MQSHTSSRSGEAILRRLPYSKTDKMGVNTQNGIVIIRYADILYCEAMGNYSRVHLHSGKSIMISKTLKHVITFLPSAEFVRTHQSYIARFDDIVAVHQDITLSNGQKIPVARGQKNTIMTYLHNRIPVV